MTSLKIKEFRKQKGLSISQLSYKSGVSRNYISELENEKYEPTVSITCKLCKALKVTPNELISEELWKW